MIDTDPIDLTHADALAAVGEIRRRVAAARARVAVWEPGPYRLHIDSRTTSTPIPLGVTGHHRAGGRRPARGRSGPDVIARGAAAARRRR